MISRTNFKSLLATAALPLLLLGACGDGGGDGGGGGDADAAPPQSEWDKALASRVTDYGQALRIASLKLRGDLPTLAEIKFLDAAGDDAAKKAAYESLINQFLDDPRFATVARDFFRDTFKMGGGALDTAPNFAARLLVEGRPFTDLFTATTATCPTFDGATGTFADAECTQNGTKVGVLTDPNVLKHYFSNMAFRRVRWVQETFACTKFPAEWAAATDVGGAAQYTSPWPFESVANADTGGRVDFRDVSAVICANCHSTMNHQAPLFAKFDMNGLATDNISVPTPLEGAPTATERDYLPEGQQYAWRLGKPVTNLTEFGASMAADPAVAECAVARVWNFALGKGDIVAALALVPSQVISAQMSEFQSSNYNLKEVFRSVFTSDDFVKF